MEIVFVVIMINVVIQSFYDIWWIMTGCYFSKEENDLKGIATEIMTFLMLLVSLFLVTIPDFFARAILFLIMLQLILRVVVKIVYHKINKTESIED